MDQITINNKLIKFLELTNPDNTNEIREKLKKGNCYGLSVVYGAMIKNGKLNWWHAALNAIVNWNETTKALDHNVCLPGSINKNPVTLKNLFEKVLNYIIYYQTTHDILNPKSNAFEMISANGRMKKIQHYETVAGYLDKNDLDYLLDEEQIRESITIITGRHHAIYLGYVNNKWIIYDPNYNFWPLKNYHWEYGSKKEAICEIFRILGNSLTIESADFDVVVNNYQSRFQQFIKSIDRKKARKLVKKNGLHQIAQNMPSEWNNIIKLAFNEDSTEEANELVTCLAIQPWQSSNVLVNIAHDPGKLASLNKILTNATNIDILLKALVAKSISGHTAFAIMAGYSPLQLEFFISLVERSPLSADLFAAALANVDNRGNSGLYYVANFAPKLLPKILNIAKQSRDFPTALVKALEKNPSWCKDTLYIITLHDPDSLSLILDYLYQSTMSIDMLMSKFLLNKNFYMRIMLNSNIRKLLKMLALSKDSANVLIDALSRRSKKKWNELQKLLHNNACSFTDIDILMMNSMYYADYLSASFAFVDENTQTGLELIMRKMPDEFPFILTKAYESEFCISFLAQALARTDANRESGIGHVARHAPQHLGLIIDYIIEDAKNADLVTAALVVRNADNVTGLDFVAPTRAKIFTFTFSAYATIISYCFIS